LLIAEAHRDPNLIVGFDFAFSLPAWYLQERQLTPRQLWALVADEALTPTMRRRNGLPGSAVAACGVVGDELGEVFQQVGWAADAVLGEQAPVFQVADRSVEPCPGGIHHHGGGVVDDLGDGHAVAHLRPGSSPGWAHGPRARPGMTRSATTGPGARSSPTRMATGSRCCWVAVRSTLASTRRSSSLARCLSSRTPTVAMC